MDVCFFFECLLYGVEFKGIDLAYEIYLERGKLQHHFYQ